MHPLQQKTPGYTWSQLHYTIYRITYGFRDLLPDYIIYNNETKCNRANLGGVPIFSFLVGNPDPSVGDHHGSCDP